jgi:hypothetical protein
VEFGRRRGCSRLDRRWTLRGAIEGGGGKPSLQQGAPPEALSQPGEQAGHTRGLLLRALVRLRRPIRSAVTEEMLGGRRTLHHEGVSRTQLLGEQRCDLYHGIFSGWVDLNDVFIICSTAGFVKGAYGLRKA